MKYISIDLETTGLNPEYCQVLQIGAVYDDTEADLSIDELKTFCCYVKHDRYIGEAYALQMNQKILAKIAGAEQSEHPVYDEKDAWTKFSTWLYAIREHERYSAQRNKVLKLAPAGKNFSGFDKNFLPNKITNHLLHRSLDPGSMVINWEDDEPMSLAPIKVQLGLPEEVTHDALDDAYDVVKIIRAVRNGR